MSKITHAVRLGKRMKLARLAEKMFKIFWDVILDRHPTFCFLCGRYIAPFERLEHWIKKPYKKGDACHDSCWKLFMKMEHTTERLSEDSELICYMDVGYVVEAKVCRTRVKNTPSAIMKHLIEFHGWRKIPELPLEAIQRETMPNDTQSLSKWKKLYLKTIAENPEKWFNDNQLIWSNYRNIHFLKPNGKSFPKVRDY